MFCDVPEIEKGNYARLFEVRKTNRKTKKIRNNWKSKYFRIVAKNENNDVILKKVKDIEKKGKTEIKKNLIYSEVLKAQILEKKKLLKTESEKYFFRKCFQVE